tara:strand:+ start:6008 stop:6259 length:252 start_codon:yes stop_codon:yes gene_type:complete
MSDFSDTVLGFLGKGIDAYTTVQTAKYTASGEKAPERTVDNSSVPADSNVQAASQNSANDMIKPALIGAGVLLLGFLAIKAAA